MKNRLKHIVPLIAASGFAAFLLTGMKYQLWFRGQQHLFVADRHFVLEALSRRGGPSDLIASLLSSFFQTPTLSAILCACALALVCMLTHLSLKKSCGLTRAGLSLIVPLSLSLSFLDGYFHLGGVVAFALTCLGVAVVTNSRRKLLAGAMLVPVLFWCGALSPSLFYETSAGEMPWIHWTCWAALPLCLLLGHLLRRRGAAALAILVLSLVPAAALYRTSESKDKERASELEWLCTIEDWDGIIASFNGNPRNDSQANYLNLALCEKGVLLDELFNYRQRGPFALISDVKSQDPIDLLRLSRVLFAMGNMAAAQSCAFNANQAFDVHPELQAMIARIDLMRGAYSVAGKSLDFLEKTNLRGWARENRRFLYDDTAVQADPVLGNGRKCFPKEEGFVLFSNPMDDLYRIVDSNPSDWKAVQYALAYLLLAKDMKSVVEFVDKYIEAGPLPVSVQECLAFFSYYYQSISDEFASSHGISAQELQANRRFDADFCRRRGVGEDVFARMDRFNRKLAELNTGRAGRSELAPFNGTFWYYLMFTEVQ